VNESQTVTNPFDPRYQNVCFYLSDRLPKGWRSFAVLTAYNPQGTLATTMANGDASEELRATLIERAIEFVPIAGSAPDNEHEEPGFGLKCEEDVARHLAQQFRQLAYYWICDGHLVLKDTWEEKGIGLGSWASKVRYRTACTSMS
jgi:hypothetical protein